MLHTAVKPGVAFFVAARQALWIRAAIKTIQDGAWEPIPYWLSSPEVSGADVAKTSYTAFSGPNALPVRLIVRRVRPTPGSQLALFTTWSYHAFVTNREGEFLELEADHLRHAIVEQRIAELKSAGLAHLPSGKFTANAAWLGLTVMAHNLSKAIGRLAGPDLTGATATTLRRKVFTVPGRLTSSGGHLTLNCPSPGPGPQPSTGPSSRSTPSPCAADQNPPPNDQELGPASSPADPARPNPCTPLNRTIKPQTA